MYWVRTANYILNLALNIPLQLGSWTWFRRTDLEGDGGAADVNQAVEVVVLAAHGLLSAVGTLPKANGADGGAAKTDEDVNTLHDNAKKAEERGDARVTSALDRVAALGGTSVALRDGGRGGDGGRKDGEDGESEGELGEHC